MNKRIEKLLEQCQWETHGVNGELLESGFAAEKFAALVSAAEREACAKVCETYETASATRGDKAIAWIFNHCSDRIRARGGKND